MRTLYITEGQERALKNRIILTEADDRIKKVNKIIEAEFGNLLPLDNTVSGPDYYVNGNPETTWRQYLLFSLRHTFGLMTNADVQYLPVVARLAFSNEVGFEKRNDNGTEIGRLQQIIMLLKKDANLFQQVKLNQNITFSQLYQQLEPQLTSIANADAEAANNVEVRNDYQIVDVPDFATANYYGNQSCSESKLCYTQGESTWNGYTKDGVNRVYVCLRNGWENVPEVPGDGNPYDEYGTSMIFVFIDPEGNLATSNCRWNHHVEGEYNGSVDHAFTKETLCRTVGVRFNDTFKPYPEDYLISKGYIPFDKVQSYLDNLAIEDRSLYEIFDYVDNPNFYGYTRVKLNGKYNYVTKDYKLLFNQWFDSLGDFYDGYAAISVNDKENFINQKGELISDQWFDSVRTFDDEHAFVYLSQYGWNAINTKGQYMFKEWFKNMSALRYGYFRVQKNDGKYYVVDSSGNLITKQGFVSIYSFNKLGISIVEDELEDGRYYYNAINTKGELISDQWFSEIDSFCDNGCARVKLNGEYNAISTEGKLLSNQWFSWVSDDDDENGCFKVEINDKYNFLSPSKGLISHQWFDCIYGFCNGFAMVELYLKDDEKKWNFINKNGELISNQWFDDCDNFSHDGRAKVEIKGKKNFINTNGEIVFPNWFDKITDFYEGFAEVAIIDDGEIKWNFINEKGEIISKQWFDATDCFYEGLASVSIDNEYNFINTNGELISKQWFDSVGDFNYGFARVKLNDKWNLINTQGKIISKMWFDKLLGFRSTGAARVMLNDKWNFINKNGELMSKEWFDHVYRFIGNYAVVEKGEMYNCISENGQLMSDTWFADDNDAERLCYSLGRKDGENPEVANESKAQHTTINEQQLRTLIENSVRKMLLTEADDRIKKTIKIIDAEFANLLNLDGPVRGPEYYVNDNPETTWRQYLLFHLRHEFSLMTNGDMKYLPVVAKLAYSNEVGFDKRNDNGTEIGILQSIVSLFKTDDTLFQQVKANIDNITFTDLYEQLKSRLEENDAIDTYNANHVDVRDDYDIVDVPDFQTANFYGNKSCSQSRLCYTQGEGTWNSYTKNGVNRVYVCLKHGWEDIPEEPGEGNPYDEYGTSMIFVFIDPDGKISTSNCRWNHHVEGSYRQDGGVDHAFTKTSLCETVGRRFDETFKPYPIEYLMKKGYVPFDMVQKLLDEGKSPRDIFKIVEHANLEGFYRVELNDKYNFIKREITQDSFGDNVYSTKLLSKKWFVYAERFSSNGFAKVWIVADKFNLINPEGRLLLPNDGVDYIGEFGDSGFAVIRLGVKWNLINTNGDLISNRWFDEIGQLENGFAKVSLDGKWNFIGTDGKFLLDTWFDYCGDVHEGFASVRTNNKWNFINSEGKILCDDWFDLVAYFDNGFCTVMKNGKYNIIDTNGKLILDMWFNDNIIITKSSISNGKIYYYLYVSSKGNALVGENGAIICPWEWFSEIGDITNGYVIVQSAEHNHDVNILNVETGEFVCEEWLNSIIPPFYTDRPTPVSYRGKYNYLLPNGKLLSDTGYDRRSDFNDRGLAMVMQNGQRFIINMNGQVVESKKSNKSIIITEAQEKMLKENVLLGGLPEDIADSVYRNKTSLGNNPAIPNIFEKGYLEKIVEKRFKETVEELKKIGEINDVPDTNVEDALARLVTKCQKLEEPNRPELEKIAANYLIDLFGIPDDSIQMELSLVNAVDLNSQAINLDPADGDEFMEYEDIADAENIKDEVYKRRLIDTISMGAGMKISANIKDYMQEIYDINPKLLDLYRKILALNDYLLFTREDLGLTEEDKKQFGTVEVVLGQGDESPKIIAQGVIFPILLSESVRGLMELFASHGLPKDLATAQSVISKADYLKAEPWDMRIGPALWEILTDSFDNHVQTDLIPYLYKRITQLPVKKFNFFMKEVLLKTRKGKRMMAKLAQKAQYEKEYGGFEDKMSKFNTDKNVITDEYIHPDEL